MISRRWLRAVWQRSWALKGRCRRGFGWRPTTPTWPAAACWPHGRGRTCRGTKTRSNIGSARRARLRSRSLGRLSAGGGYCSGLCAALWRCAAKSSEWRSRWTTVWRTAGAPVWRTSASTTPRVRRGWTFCDINVISTSACDNADATGRCAPCEWLWLGGSRIFSAVGRLDYFRIEPLFFTLSLFFVVKHSHAPSFRSSINIVCTSFPLSALVEAQEGYTCASHSTQGRRRLHSGDNFPQHVEVVDQYSICVLSADPCSTPAQDMIRTVWDMRYCYTWDQGFPSVPLFPVRCVMPPTWANWVGVAALRDPIQPVFIHIPCGCWPTGIWTELTRFRNLDVACGLRFTWDRELRLQEDRNRFHIRSDGDLIPPGSRPGCPWASPRSSLTIWVLKDLYTGHLEVPQHLSPCCFETRASDGGFGCACCKTSDQLLHCQHSACESVSAGSD